MCAITKKVLRYEAGRDDRGKAYESLHTVWVQAMYEPHNTLRLFWQS
jgi:hypothetical protein